MKKYIKHGGNVFTANVEHVTDSLEVGVYNLAIIDKNFALNVIHENFPLPEKIYGDDSVFVERAIKTFNNTNTNMGVLLCGMKGTGKTVTAKMLCNSSNLPVIMVGSKFEMPFSNYIQDIKQDLVVFIDEFEKIFGDDPYNEDENNGPLTAQLLSLLDGSMDNGFRRIFVLTSNSKHINSHFLQRPGRIRYLKEYDNLNLELVHEILEDKLNDKTNIEEITKTISKLEVITMDVLTKIIEEINIHGDLPESFIPFFNVEYVQDTYDVYRVSEDGVDTLVFMRADFNAQGIHLYINGNYEGNIDVSKSRPKDGLYTVKDNEGEIVKYKKIKTIGYNKIFSKVF